MRGFDEIPIWHFVTTRYMTPPVQKVVETWRVEPTQVVEKLVDHFRELGIFRVPRNQEGLVMRTLLFQLKHSPDIHRLIARNNQEEQRRNRARHAD